MNFSILKVDAPVLIPSNGLPKKINVVNLLLGSFYFMILAKNINEMW
jgi:hypothetical protein